MGFDKKYIWLPVAQAGLPKEDKVTPSSKDSIFVILSFEEGGTLYQMYLFCSPVRTRYFNSFVGSGYPTRSHRIFLY